MLRQTPCISRLLQGLRELVAYHTMLKHGTIAALHHAELEHIFGNIDAEDLNNHDSLLVRPLACGAGRGAIHPVSKRKQDNGIEVNTPRCLNLHEREHSRLRKAVLDLTPHKAAAIKIRRRTKPPRARD